MKKIIFILLIFATASCTDDFLDRGSLTQLAEGNFWQTERDALLGINGIYDVLQDKVMYGGNLNGQIGLPNHDSFADNLFNNYKFEGAGNFMEGRADPAMGYFHDFWSANYRGIARANTAIENIGKISTDNIAEEMKDALIGQARFLRALFYFNLAVYFEEVPLILEVQTLDNAYVPKNTYDEIAAQIISDLEFAGKNLSPRYDADLYGYATKGAALSLLTRFQLYNKNYQEVIELTDEILTLGYALHPDYEQLFSEEGEFSKEVIFSVRFFQDQSDNGETFSATYAGIPKVNMQPMPNMVNDYYAVDGLPITVSPLYDASKPKEKRDPRLAASVYFKGDIFMVHLNRPFKGNTATTYGLKKYIRDNESPDGIGPGAAGGQDFYVIRYGDVLLMRAEALAEAGEELDEVYTLVNEVRDRVGMPHVEDVEGTNLTQEQLVDVVRHERRVELAFEGLRFFDVKRWDEVADAYQRAIDDNINGYNPVYRGGMSEVFPVPLAEMDANDQLIQNPVW